MGAMKSKASPSLLRRARRLAGNVQRGAVNALEWVREGRLGEPYQAPNEVVFESAFLVLRRFTTRPGPFGAEDGPTAGPLLLIPPLMVTASVYDISPELSATAALAARGLDLYVADFGAPEDAEGGLGRTIDDHVLAVDRAISYLHERTGRGVHLAGYSQGGMFAYLAAAFRESAQVASLITFGSPVDMRRNLPLRLHEDVAARVLDVAHGALSGVLSRIEALPADFTSLAFKLISPRQELKHFVHTVGTLHDKDALLRSLPKRQFLGGEGFVAWPGPAFRTMVTEFVAHNRMASGGFVVAGRTISLSDIVAPILYFVGDKDEMARPPSVRAIRRAAASPEIFEQRIPAGHFGLVVGSRAIDVTWPLVADWVTWRDGAGPKPASLGEAVSSERAPVAAASPTTAAAEGERDDLGASAGRISEKAAELGQGVSLRLGELSRQALSLFSILRWQMPRLAQLARLREDSQASFAAMLSEQARAIPENPFFLWHGRAFTYAEANERVSELARVLYAAGVRPGDRVGVFMANHPRYLTAVTALNRMGAVAVLLPAEARGLSLEHVLRAGGVQRLIADAAHAALARESFPAGPLYVLGRLATTSAADGTAVESPLPEGAVHLSPLVGQAPPLPGDVPVDAGRAGDLAMLLFTSGTTGLPKAARITNRRCVLAGLGAAAACRTTPGDTVYCCLPLHHASGMLIACGGALAGGARLALSARFSRETFWSEIRRTGATIVVYVGELCRYITSAPVQPGERHHPVRVFVGNGLRPQVWERLRARFGNVRVLEFYSSTEGNVLLANLTGDKLGSVGRGFGDDDGDLALVEYDFECGEPVRGADGRLLVVPEGQPGLLLARVDPSHPLGCFDGYTDNASTTAKLVQGAFSSGDTWFNTGDLLRRDADGDFWFVDRLGDTFRWKGENVSTEEVAQVLGRSPMVAMAVAYGVSMPGREGRAGMAALELHPEIPFDGKALGELVHDNLPPSARPRFLRLTRELEWTETWKPKKQALAAEGADPEKLNDKLYYYNELEKAYHPLTAEIWDGFVKVR